MSLTGHQTGNWVFGWINFGLRVSLNSSLVADNLFLLVIIFNFCIHFTQRGLIVGMQAVIIAKKYSNEDQSDRSKPSPGIRMLDKWWTMMSAWREWMVGQALTRRICTKVYLANGAKPHRRCNTCPVIISNKSSTIVWQTYSVPILIKTISCIFSLVEIRKANCRFNFHFL